MAVLELLVLEDETLLLGWNALHVVDDGLHVADRGGSLDVQGDGLGLRGLHVDLHVGILA